MVGGPDNDTYEVDDAGDVVLEFADWGTADRVVSSISYTLSDDVEQLFLAGASAIDGTGNALNNLIIGNAAVNTIDGGEGNDTLNGLGGDDVLTGGTGNDRLNGGAGADSMFGGIGNDTYYVDDAGDTVIELSGQGTDMVKSSVDFTLGDNVERLTLTGTAAIDGTGNALNNIITGNAAVNTIDGGEGNDRLTGGAGADAFVFDTAPNGSTNVDKIIDFAVGEDMIHLDQAVFSAIGIGTLSSAAFASGTAAQDADDRIIYDSASGNIYYDGDGAGAAVLFAQVTAGTALTNADFMIIG
jgi:Ca2+-binding RTX toxin-like protein